jgi:hypothetical protein
LELKAFEKWGICASTLKEASILPFALMDAEGIDMMGVVEIESREEWDKR